MTSSPAPPLLVPAAPPPLVVPQVGTDLNKYIGAYVNVRNNLKALDDAHKAKRKPYVDMLEVLDNAFLAHLQATGTDSCSVRDVGTVYTKTKRSASIADASEFRRFVIGGEHWDLVDWRANAPQISQFAHNNGAMPPGVNYSEVLEVGVRKS